MNLNINLIRKFAIFILFLFLLNGLTNIVNPSHYSYIFLGILQTVTSFISIMFLFFKKDSSQKFRNNVPK